MGGIVPANYVFLVFSGFCNGFFGFCKGFGEYVSILSVFVRVWWA